MARLGRTLDLGCAWRLRRSGGTLRAASDFGALTASSLGAFLRNRVGAVGNGLGDVCGSFGGGLRLNLGFLSHINHPVL